MMKRELQRRLNESFELAKKDKSEFVTLEHVLLSVSEDPAMVEILESCGANVPRLKKKLRDLIKKHSAPLSDELIKEYGGYESWQPELTLAVHRLLQRAALQVQSAGRKEITEGHLLVAFFYEQESFAVHCLRSEGVEQFDVINFISHGIAKDELSTSVLGEAESEGTDVDGFPKDSSKEEKRNALDSFCTNLNEKAKQGKVDPLVGRQDVLARMMQVLCRRTKNNPLLIGEPGVGKTAVAEGLALKIVAGEVPDLLQNKVIYSMDVGTLLAGTKFRGDFEARLKAILKEISLRKNIILFIDEIHTLVGAGATSGGSMDAANLLKPALANGDISCIGSTTHQEYRQHFEKDRALHRRFQKIDIQEPTVPEAIEILKGLKPQFEKFHQVEFTDAAVQAAVELSSKYIHGKLLPDKAIDLIDEAGSYARLHPELSRVLDVEQIEAVIAHMTQIPMANIASNEVQQLKHLDMKLKALIYGQDEAIEQLVAAIKLSKSGLARDNKPIGSYLFAGPTGVGKTEVCKQLALQMGIPFLRFDMSEYLEKHSLARLIGAPPGYVGYEEGGQLTEAVHKNPYAVVLLDEIEKAHPDIYAILLQVMDAGRLTDSNGRTTDFRNVILVMTSNAGAADVAKGSIGFVDISSRHTANEAIKKTFAPEFINRLDAIVHFKDLNENVLLQIVSKFVEEVQRQLQRKNVFLELDEDARKFLMKRGYDKVYGARPMARAIDDLIKKPMVDELLFGRLTKGGRVFISLKDQSLSFDYQAHTLSLDAPLKV